MKVQKQHKARPNILSPSPIPLSLMCDSVWEGKHTSTMSKKTFFSFAAMAISSFGSCFCPSLPFFFLPPSFLCHIWNPASLYLRSLFCFFFSKALFLSSLPSLVGSFTPSDEVCNYTSPYLVTLQLHAPPQRLTSLL